MSLNGFIGVFEWVFRGIRGVFGIFGRVLRSFKVVFENILDEFGMKTLVF